MVKSARCLASHETRYQSGDDDRNPFVTYGRSWTPREMAEIANAEKAAMRRRMKRIRRAANGEEAND